VIFGNSSHMPFRERDAEAYLDVIRGFLRRVRARKEDGPDAR
jgi:hypothetical protein